jgi:hypothetical protein
MNAFPIVLTRSLYTEDLPMNPKETAGVTRGMMRQRAVELAVIEGRKPHEACKSDWENAKRELVGQL